MVTFLIAPPQLQTICRELAKIANSALMVHSKCGAAKFSLRVPAASQPAALARLRLTPLYKCLLLLMTVSIHTLMVPLSPR